MWYHMYVRDRYYSGDKERERDMHQDYHLEADYRITVAYVQL